MHPVIHFEIHAAKPEEAAKFYSDVFGWSVKKWDGPFPYWLVSTKSEKGNGIDGAIVSRRGPGPADGAPVNAYVCTIVVDSLDGSMEKVKSSGGQIAVEKSEVPTIGWLAYAKDPEGNLFGMLEPTM
jgi:predicted enzyme related to lactoylglutathione lyase